MEDHCKFIADYLISNLNQLGIIKDAQVNSTTTGFMAAKISEYMKSQHIEFINKK